MPPLDPTEVLETMTGLELSYIECHLPYLHMLKRVLVAKVSEPGSPERRQVSGVVNHPRESSFGRSFAGAAHGLAQPFRVSANDLREALSVSLLKLQQYRLEAAFVQAPGSGAEQDVLVRCANEWEWIGAPRLD